MCLATSIQPDDAIFAYAVPLSFRLGRPDLPFTWFQVGPKARDDHAQRLRSRWWRHKTTQKMHFSDQLQHHAAIGENEIESFQVTYL